MKNLPNEKIARCQLTLFDLEMKTSTKIFYADSSFKSILLYAETLSYTTIRSTTLQ